jgi:NAD(P)-dependent dehydrogenase (short-subunit alcohol dehydrogenase family)
MTELSGRHCLVTGATHGIGRATAEALAKMGATVLLHGRDSASVGAVCREVVRATRNPDVEGVVGDFGSLAAVRRLAAEINARERLDVLIANAGVLTRKRQVTQDGFEMQFGVNHLAPFLLTNLLLDVLKRSAPARIVIVASRAHQRGVLDFDDLNAERNAYSGFAAYCNSKLANMLFALELARRLEGANVTANSLHPGLVATRLFRHLGLFGKILSALSFTMLSPARGAETSVYLASSPDVAGVSGRYFTNRRPAEPAPAAVDAEAARRLWDLSAKLTGLNG